MEGGAGGVLHRAGAAMSYQKEPIIILNKKILDGYCIADTLN